MTECHEPTESIPSITEDYERRVLRVFVDWYQKESRTINAAASEAYCIARDTVRGLTATQVVTLLQEHTEWTHQKPEERNESDNRNITIGEIARRHFVQYLEHLIQQKGLQAVSLSQAEAHTVGTEEMNE